MLGTDLATGLRFEEATRRLVQDGPNELRAAKVTSLWRRTLAQFQDPLVNLLPIAVVIALIAWMVEGRVGWSVDAIVIAAVVLLTAALGFAQEARAEGAVAALARMTAASSALLRDGREQRVPSAQLLRGDLLVLGDASRGDRFCSRLHRVLCFIGLPAALKVSCPE